MNKEDLWQAALNEIELSISKANFNTWFKNTQIALKKDGAVTISVPNAFTKEWLENKYDKFILRALRNVSTDIKNVTYVIKFNALEHAGKQKTPPKVLSLEKQLSFPEFEVDKETNLNPKYTFDAFIVGSSNELAHAASKSVANNLGKEYNPLFLYGGVGLGKTHLLQAIGNEIIKKEKKKKIKYVSSEKFTSELINAIQNQDMDKFKDFYRKIDVLIIDDVQFLAGKEKTQEEFFHTFNDLYSNNKQIILSSDRPPKAIPTLEERLRSRFEGGMIADISYPDYETRLAILKAKSKEKGIQIPDDILHYIATHIQKNIRELEGALNRVAATAKLSNLELSINKTAKILSSVISTPKQRTNYKTIIKKVAEFYDIQEIEIINKGRKREIVKPRQIVMYLMREELKNSYPFIGEKIGGRDHTTVIHACSKIENEINKNDAFNEELNLIKERLYG